MLGHILFVEEKGRRPREEYEQVRGMNLLGMAVPVRPETGERTIARRVDKAARLLVKAGVRRVLAPENFPRWDILRQRGLVGVDPVPLCAMLAAPLAIAALERRGIAPQKATVSLRGIRVSRPFFQAAAALAPLVRGVVITSPNGGEALAAHLRREYGVPILEEGGGAESDLTVVFSPLANTGRDAVTLYGKPELQGVKVLLKEENWPDQFEVLPLAAALWEAGALSLGNLICA